MRKPWEGSEVGADGSGPSVIVAHPSAAGRAPNPRTVRTRWLAALEAARADGGVKGLIIYETPDGEVGIAPTCDVSAAHTHGLLIAAIGKFNGGADDDSE